MGAASFLVTSCWFLITCFKDNLQLKNVTKKIERTAGKWKPKEPTVSVQEKENTQKIDSIQKKDTKKRSKNIFFKFKISLYICRQK